MAEELKLVLPQEEKEICFICSLENNIEKIEKQKEEIIKKSKKIDETIKNNKSINEINNIEREELQKSKPLLPETISNPDQK